MTTKDKFMRIKARFQRRFKKDPEAVWMSTYTWYCFLSEMNCYGERYKSTIFGCKVVFSELMEDYKFKFL